MKKLMIILGILIILTSSVLGFGVTDWLTGPINVAPGGSHEVVFELQNMLGNEDIIAKTQIKEGGDIASIKEGNEIEVPFGVKKNIHVLVEIPENYNEGEYSVSIQFLTSPKQRDGPVQFNTGITKTFGVVVNKNIPVSEALNIPISESPAEQEKAGFGNTGIVAILIMLSILLVIIIIVKFIHKKE